MIVVVFALPFSPSFRKRRRWNVLFLVILFFFVFFFGDDDGGDDAFLFQSFEQSFRERFCLLRWNGLIGGDGNFVCPERLETALAADRAADTPCCVIYSTDTVGGNSGSPVLNAAGEFVAINFDRQRQGLMNEYKWSHAYSRSIGVDVRYILFLVGDYDGCPGLVDEMIQDSMDMMDGDDIEDDTAVEVDKVVAELTGDLFKGKDADAPLPTSLPADAAPAAPVADAAPEEDEDDLDTMKARLQAL